MTYGAFLLVFLVVPTVVLALTLRGRFRRHHGIALGLVCLLAFVYTTPWDNYAAYKRLWSFDPAFVLGKPFWFGYLPLEEYLFYFAEAVFVCLALVALSRVPALHPADEDRPLPPGPFPPKSGGRGVQYREKQQEQQRAAVSDSPSPRNRGERAGG